jgi:hypothetical protein
MIGFELKYSLERTGRGITLGLGIDGQTGSRG